MLVERLARWDVPVWLVNTGWTGGPYGTGERMNINHTRAMVRAALDGRLDDGRDGRGPDLPRGGAGRAVPMSRAEFLQPRSTWQDKDAYDTAARKLAAMFAANFATYADGVAEGVREAGPRVDR